VFAGRIIVDDSPGAEIMPWLAAARHTDAARSAP
jgi:hypothetical protein